MQTKYLMSLIAGAVISLAPLTVSKDLLTPAEAQSDPNVFSVFDESESSTLVAQVYDDGQQLPGGAHISLPSEEIDTAAVKTVYVYRHPCRRVGNGWWTRGHVRRVISWPIRQIIARRRCR